MVWPHLLLAHQLLMQAVAVVVLLDQAVLEDRGVVAQVRVVRPRLVQLTQAVVVVDLIPHHPVLEDRVL